MVHAFKTVGNTRTVPASARTCPRNALVEAPFESRDIQRGARECDEKGANKSLGCQDPRNGIGKCKGV